MGEREVAHTFIHICIRTDKTREEQTNKYEMYKFGVASILAVLVLGSVTCTNAQPGPDVEGPSIVELAFSEPDLSSLVDAVVAADLVPALSDPSTTYTVFAPTNEAFASLLDTLGVETVDDIDTDTLTKVLKYHVAPVAALSTDLTDGQVLDTLDVPETLTVDLSDGVKIVGIGSTATVIAPDNLAGNNVVHVIDEVLLPFELPGSPSEEPTTEPAPEAPTVEDDGIPFDIPSDSIAGVALTVPDLSILVEALIQAGLVGEFVDPTSTFTVLAPTNEAFVAALAALSFDSLEDIPIDTLADVLKYHVITVGAVTSDQLTDGQVIPTLNGAELTVDLTSEPGSVIFKGVGSDAKVVIPDVAAGDSVVHVIDTVLLPFPLTPPSPPSPPPRPFCRVRFSFCRFSTQCCSGHCRRRFFSFFGRCAPTRH